MKKRIIMCGLVFTMFTMLAGCSSSGSGVAPIVTVEGVELTIGESDIMTLIQTDESLEAKVGTGLLMPMSQLDSQSWISENISVYKENKKYATFNIYNPSNESENALSCPISKVLIDLEKTNALINGIDFSKMDSPGVKETMQNYKLARETDTGTLRYEDGDYKYFFSFDDEGGLVNEITVEFSFPKSYDEKLW